MIAAPPMSEPETDNTLARLRATSENSRFTVKVESAAWHHKYYYEPRRLLTLSCVGSDTAIKAIRAMLLDPEIPVRLDFWDDDADRTTMLAKASENGGRKLCKYATRVARLARGATHLVATAKMDGLLRELSDDALWLAFSGDDFDTPVLRGWVPWLRKKLEENDLLQSCDGYNQSVGVLLASSAQLDELVSRGVKTGNLKMEDE
jgi:hypothetical protein